MESIIDKDCLVKEHPYFINAYKEFTSMMEIKPEYESMSSSDFNYLYDKWLIEQGYITLYNRDLLYGEYAQFRTPEEATIFKLKWCQR